MNTEEILQEQPQQEETTVVAEEKKKKSALFYINIILLLLIVGLGGYILYKEGYWAKHKEHEMEETEEATEKKKGEGSVIVEVKETEVKEKDTTSKDFVGEFITAKLPEGWSIVEYEEKDAMEIVSDGAKLNGLTGLDIKKGTMVVFKLQGMEGYGSNACPEIAHFKDFSQKYEDDIKAQNDEMGDKTTVLDFTNTPYTETKLFGIKTRRVEKTIYYDTVEDDSYFQPQCLKQVLIFKDLKFSAGEGAYKTENGDFKYTIHEDATAEELTVLDGILKSMAVK